MYRIDTEPSTRQPNIATCDLCGCNINYRDGYIFYSSAKLPLGTEPTGDMLICECCTDQYISEVYFNTTKSQRQTLDINELAELANDPARHRAWVMESNASGIAYTCKHFGLDPCSAKEKGRLAAQKYWENSVSISPAATDAVLPNSLSSIATRNICQTRPVTVTVIAVLLLISSVISLIILPAILFVTASREVIQKSGLSLDIFSFIQLIGCLLFLVIGIGMLQGLSNARLLLYISFPILIIINIVFRHGVLQPLNIVGLIVSIIAYSIVLLFLTRNNVEKYFIDVKETVTDQKWQVAIGIPLLTIIVIIFMIDSAIVTSVISTLNSKSELTVSSHKPVNEQDQTIIATSHIPIFIPSASTINRSNYSSIIVRIKGNSTYYINAEKTTKDGLRQLLQSRYNELSEGNNIPVIVIEADDDIQYTQVINVIDIARQLGFQNISLAKRRL